MLAALPQLVNQGARHSLTNVPLKPAYAVGAVLGFGIVYGGAAGVTWNKVDEEVCACYATHHALPYCLL